MDLISVQIQKARVRLSNSPRLRLTTSPSLSPHRLF